MQPMLVSVMSHILTNITIKATVDLRDDGTVEKPVNREAPVDELVSR